VQHTVKEGKSTSSLMTTWAQHPSFRVIWIWWIWRRGCCS